MVRYYESFAETHKGHGTDFAIIAGILGFAADDSKVPDSIKIAKSKGIDITFIEKSGDSPAGHPNTADVYLEDDSRSIRTMGISVGGGLIEIKHVEIDGFSLELKGHCQLLLRFQKELTLNLSYAGSLKQYDMEINNFYSLEENRNFYLYSH